MSRIKGYTQEWNKVLLALYGLINSNKPDAPEWIKDKKHWEVSEMRAMQAYVETLDGKKLPIKWVWRKILSPFGITQKDLSTSQIAHFFKDIGFKTGSFGKEGE
jgi:hypothetical protein